MIAATGLPAPSATPTAVDTVPSIPDSPRFASSCGASPTGHAGATRSIDLMAPDAPITASASLASASSQTAATVRAFHSPPTWVPDGSASQEPEHRARRAAGDAQAVAVEDEHAEQAAEERCEVQ